MANLEDARNGPARRNWEDPAKGDCRKILQRCTERPGQTGREARHRCFEDRAIAPRAVTDCGGVSSPARKDVRTYQQASARKSSQGTPSRDRRAFFGKTAVR